MTNGVAWALIICFLVVFIPIFRIHVSRSRAIKGYWEKDDYFGGMEYCIDLGLYKDAMEFREKYIKTKCEKIFDDIITQRENIKLYFEMNEKDSWT